MGRHTRGRRAALAMDSPGQSYPEPQEPPQHEHDQPEWEERAAEPTDPALEQKAAEILDACQRRDVGQLRSLAESRGGLLRDSLRQAAWPLLLGLSLTSTDSDGGNHHQEANSNESASFTGAWKDLPLHRDEAQVQLDVNRSFIYYPNDQTDSELRQRKTELSALIVEVLRRHPYLCYFQGFHDICQVFLLVLAQPWRAPVVARLSVLRIRDFMLPSLGPTTAQLRLLPDILSRADPKLWHHLTGVEPFYALSGTLTMYAHNIEAYHDIARLFDVFLAQEPVFSVYMFAQIVLDRRDEIFEIEEPDMLHVILGKVPPKMDLDALIADSISLLSHYPPETLRSWKSISSASTLKTVRNVDSCAIQTMEDGREFFQKQVKELQWIELQDQIKATFWAYRRPLMTAGTSIAVGALAFYLRRNPAIVNYTVNLVR